MRTSTFRRNVGALALSLVLSPALYGTADAGFLDQFFGTKTETPAPPPSARPEALPDRVPDVPLPVVVRRPKPNYEKPVLQKTTDLMRDATLRPGDAVMTGTGIEVYEGEVTTRHSRRQFVPLRAASSEVPKSTMTKLAATEGAHASRTGESVTGRSVAGPDAPVPGRVLRDPNGRAVRYVGP